MAEAFKATIPLARVHECANVHVTVNMPISVNKTPVSAAGVERALAEKLRQLLGKVDWLKDWSLQNFPTISEQGFDFLVKLAVPKNPPIELWVQCKADPRPSLFPYAYVATGRKPQPVYVFAAPYISPRLAELCQKEGWSWFDLAGNYRLDIPGLLRLEQTGNAPVHEPPRPKANLGTPEAGRVIRALLWPEHAGMRWTQRYMAEHFGELEKPIPEPSLGLVNKVVRHLREEAFIEELPDGGFQLRDPLKLLLAWRDAYRFDRHERRSYFTLLQGKKLRDALAGLGLQTGGFAVYASFSAADFQAPYVRQPRTWLYVRQQEIAMFENLVEAKAVDSGENIVVLVPDDDGVFYLGDGGMMGDHRLACTNAVQTYVDLWHSGGRGQEAAEALLEQKLKPEWKIRGMKL